MPHKDAEEHRAYQANWRARNVDRSNAFQRKSALKKLEEKAGRPCPELCEICEKSDATGRRLAFDHDHSTGAFRGWLCGSCNNAIGRLKDDAVLARKIADYLENTKGFTNSFLV